MKRVKEENRRARECKVEVAPLPLPNVWHFWAIFSSLIFFCFGFLSYAYWSE
jgi:hypothetical protein